MGVSARMRYGISWIIIKAVMPVIAWIASGLVFLNVGVAMFALWFSPELKQRETMRILRELAEKPSEDD